MPGWLITFAGQVKALGHITSFIARPPVEPLRPPNGHVVGAHRPVAIVREQQWYCAGSQILALAYVYDQRFLPLPPPDPQPVTRSIVEVLAEPQVALGSLDRGVPQGNLDLLERRAAEVGKLGEGAP